MNVPRYAAAAAKLLGRHVPAPLSSSGDRARGIATIQAALAARSRRRRLLWAGAGAGLAVAVAASALIAVGLRSVANGPVPSESVAIRVAPSQGVSLLQGERSRSLAEQTLLEPGQWLETNATGSAALALSTGTALELGATTSFSVDSQTNVERFSLRRGRLSANVAKLTAGQRFIVATPDVEMEVRGTKFRIDVLERGEACGGGSRSRLSVSEGVVEVRGDGFAAVVRAGQQWPQDCSGLGAAPARSELVDEPELRTDGAPPKSSAPRPSLIARANDLFAEGVARRRQGDVAGALRAYEDVMTRFPASPLAENALVERMRLLASSSSAKARVEAQRYLARYPRGFAVEEARQLAAKP
jgi:hypothetical protein